MARYKPEIVFLYQRVYTARARLLQVCFCLF